MDIGIGIIGVKLDSRDERDRLQIRCDTTANSVILSEVSVREANGTQSKDPVPVDRGTRHIREFPARHRQHRANSSSISACAGMRAFDSVAASLREAATYAQDDK